MRFRRGPRKASKIQKKNLIENAKKLAKDPMKVIPECRDNCLFCKFGRSKRKIKKIEKYSDDESKLEKYSKRGPDLSKAVASTILFGIQEEAKQITTAKTPAGEIAYAKKGDSSKKRLIGVQHFPDPKKRLIAYSKEADKGFYFYSLEDKVICTGKTDAPPKRFVNSAIDRLNYDLHENQDGEFYCDHCKEKSDEGLMKLEWKEIDKKFIICEKCANDQMNLYKSLTERMLSPDNSKSFEIKGKIGLKCEGDCERCKLTEDIPVSENLREDYFKSLSDEKFISLYSEEAIDIIKNKYDLFIIGDICFGKDKESFLEHIDYDDWEKPALIELLKNVNGAVLEEGTVNEFLEKYWHSYKEKVLKAILDDQESIEEILSLNIRPREKLRELKQVEKEKQELASLPEFKKLPPEAKFADSIARVFKVRGKEEAINEMENYNLSDKKLKSIAFGFYTAFGKGDSKRWKYEDSEVESGEFLSEFIEKLLESDDEEYAEHLQQVVKMSGSTEAIVLESGKKMR